MFVSKDGKSSVAGLRRGIAGATNTNVAKIREVPPMNRAATGDLFCPVRLRFWCRPVAGIASAGEKKSAGW